MSSSGREMARAPTSQREPRPGYEAAHERLALIRLFWALLATLSVLDHQGDMAETAAAAPYFIELRSQQRRQALLADYDLEAGGQAHRVGGGAAAPVQQPPEVSQRLDAVMVQAFAAFLPACVTAYPLLKDAPDYIKFTIFWGLTFTTVGLFVGILSKSVARRGLAIRLVSFSAIAILAFCAASQLSSRIYVALTALVGVVLNLIIMLLRF